MSYQTNKVLQPTFADCTCLNIVFNYVKLNNAILDKPIIHSFKIIQYAKH